MTFVPPTPTDVSRRLWLAEIARQPSEAQFRGAPITVRLAEPSARRRMEVAGYSPDLADLDCMVALPDDMEEPEPMRDSLELRRKPGAPWERYRITEVAGHPGPGCYRLTLTRANP
jgi:hypothetical protein